MQFVLQDIWQVVLAVEDIAWMSIPISIALLQEYIYIWSCVKRIWIAPFYRLSTTLSVFNVLASAFGLFMALNLYVPDIRWILSFMAKIWTSSRISLFRTYQSTSVVVWSTIDRKVSTLVEPRPRFMTFCRCVRNCWTPYVHIGFIMLLQISSLFSMCCSCVLSLERWLVNQYMPFPLILTRCIV